MKQSKSIVKLSAALVLAQADIGGAVKDASNPFFKSKYADLTSVIKAVKEPLLKHGLTYIQLPKRSESGVGVVTRLIHASGEWLEDEFTLPTVKNDPQSAGATLTYARRYALASLFGVPQVDDDAESAMFRHEEVKTVEQWNKELAASISVIQESIGSGNYSAGSEAWQELSTDEKHGIWVATSKGGAFTTHERKVMQSTEFKNGDKVVEP